MHVSFFFFEVSYAFTVIQGRGLITHRRLVPMYLSTDVIVLLLKGKSTSNATEDAEW